ncbi:MAG: Bax inhibitor-1/YccA family protein [Muribaculaceae bacterium]|nr:Bax inhibitor-1/YccA family protein [Muribaculaceae bacterium]
MNNYNFYSDGNGQQTVVYTQSVAKVMRSVYLRMFLGLLATAFTAMFVASQESLMLAIFGNKIFFWGLIIAEFACVIGISGAINKISTAMAVLLFFVYAIINGVTLASIFWVFKISTIAQTFFITAGVFGAMSAYGYLTRADLSKFGAFLFMALIGLIITSVVNIFFMEESKTLDWVISLVGVGIFIGLTAWDTQKIKMMVMQSNGYNVGKIATLGALSLYLDFINLFLYLLRIFGSRD